MSTKLTDEQVALFCESMGMMYRAGITTAEAVNLSAQDENESALADVLKPVADKLATGASLADALKSSAAFPNHMTSLVDAAEEAGRLEDTMFSLSRYYVGQMRLQNRLRSALLYPMILLVLMAVVLLVMVWKVLPLFSDVYTSMSGAMDQGAWAYAQAAPIISYIALGVAILAAIVFAVGAAMVYFGRNTSTVSRMLERLPLTSKASYSNSLASTLDALATYAASGIDIENALETLIPEAGNRVLRGKLESISEAMQGGESFAHATFESSLLDPIYARMLVNGEQSGSFDRTLGYISDLLQEDATRRTDKVIATIEPVCAAFLTISVALTLVAVMVPLVGILGAIG